MCLIIHKPAGQEVAMETIESARAYNQDGIGIMHNGVADKWTKIKTVKVYDKLNSAENAAVHFRMATHGRVDRNNVHPFRLADNGWLMHNGILGKYAPAKGMKDSKSDTALFCERFCNPIIKQTGKLSLRAVETEIGSNAVAIMQRKRITRLGHGWNEYDGSWFSNQYAWDCPTRYQFDRYDDFWDDLDTDYTGKGYRSRDGYRDTSGYKVEHLTLDELADDYLWQCVESLDLATNQFISVQDDDAYDRLWDENGSVEQFLDEIGPETKLRLLTNLVDSGFLRI